MKFFTYDYPEGMFLYAYPSLTMNNARFLVEVKIVIS